jgi:hypothetical protein
LTFEQFYKWYSLKNDNSDSRKKWTHHWSILNSFPPVSVDNILFVLAKFYPTLRQPQKLRLFIDQFNLPNDNIIKVDTLTQDIFKNDNKFTIVNTGMGSGKTAQTIDKLMTVDNFLWMTPNVALAQNTHHRMTENKIDCCYYKDTKIFKSS